MPVFTIDPSTRAWMAQTLAGYVLLVLWILSIINPPVVILDSTVQTVVFSLAVGALGLQAVQSYRAVGQAQTAKRS